MLVELSVANLGEFDYKEVPRGSVATEPGEGSRRRAGCRSLSKKLLENRTLNGGFWGHFKLKIVNICYCFFAGKNVFTANLDPQELCLMEMP